MEPNLKVNLLNDKTAIRTTHDWDAVKNIKCLICDRVFKLLAELDDYLGHLFLAHRIVISDVADIFLVEEYLDHWQGILNESNLPSYCSTMLLNQRPDGTASLNEEYYLLGPIIPEDADLRQRLNQKFLAIVLEQHTFDLKDQSFKRGCIFCRDVIEPSRADFVDHLYSKHCLWLGKAERLVFVDHLFDRLESQMENLICLFCEKIFKDRMALKEHMRKKGHKKINPANKGYDKYFMTNYYKEERPRENRKETRSTLIPHEEDTSLFNDSEDSDTDWLEPVEMDPLTCLFCATQEADYASIARHMKQEHNFSLDEALNDRDFYIKVKIINYIRRQILTLRCVFCMEKHQSLDQLQKHMAAENHCALPEAGEPWNKPEYFFSTFEDDALLLCIDKEDDPETADSVCVYAEDKVVATNEIAESLSRDLNNKL